MKMSALMFKQQLFGLGIGISTNRNRVNVISALSYIIIPKKVKNEIRQVRRKKLLFMKLQSQKF